MNTQITTVTEVNFPDKYAKGVRSIAKSVNEYNGKNIVTYCEQDASGLPHGIYTVESEHGNYKYHGIYEHGKLHNRTGPARVVYDENGNPENKYYIDGVEQSCY